MAGAAFNAPSSEATHQVPGAAHLLEGRRGASVSGRRLRFTGLETLAPSTTAGLSEAEAARRLKECGTPREQATSRSYLSIAIANTFTVFNAIDA